MSWFRMYDEVLNDPKVQRLSPPLFKAWVNLLCLASQHHGILPPLPDVAYSLRLSPAQAFELLARLWQAGLLDRNGDETFQPHNWDRRQYKSDVSTERVRKHRISVSGNGIETFQERPVKRHQSRAEQIRAEADAEQSKNGVVLPLLRAFERSFGRMLSPNEIESMKALEEEHPRERIDYALREASDLGKRSVRYVQRVCEGEQTRGDDRGERKQMGGNAGGAAAAGDTTAAALSRYGYVPEYIPDYWVGRELPGEGLREVDAPHDPEGLASGQ